MKLLRPYYFFLLSSFGFYTIYFQYLVPLTLLGCVVVGESVWEDVLSLVFVMFCHVCCVLCMCWFFFFFFFFFFETDHAVHGLSQIALCVYSIGEGWVFLGWGGFFVALKKIWVCCHVQVYVQLYDALIFISMSDWLYFHFWFILGLTTFGYSVMAVLIFWLFLLGLVHSLPTFLHNFAWSWLLQPLSQW